MNESINRSFNGRAVERIGARPATGAAKLNASVPRCSHKVLAGFETTIIRLIGERPNQ